MEKGRKSGVSMKRITTQPDVIRTYLGTLSQQFGIA